MGPLILDFGFPILDSSQVPQYSQDMTETEFKQRTKRFALQVIDFCEELPRNRTCDVLGKQLLRSGTSVGANYRAACRGRSVAEVLAKLGNVEEEADESMYWLELLEESGSV